MVAIPGCDAKNLARNESAEVVVKFTFSILGSYCLCIGCMRNCLVYGGDTILGSYCLCNGCMRNCLCMVAIPGCLGVTRGIWLQMEVRQGWSVWWLWLWRLLISGIVCITQVISV
jgi:hypothetical protein